MLCETSIAGSTARVAPTRRVERAKVFIEPDEVAGAKLGGGAHCKVGSIRLKEAQLSMRATHIHKETAEKFE
jgi:hypothetical protein